MEKRRLSDEESDLLLTPVRSRQESIDNHKRIYNCTHYPKVDKSVFYYHICDHGEEYLVKFTTDEIACKDCQSFMGTEYSCNERVYFAQKN